MERQLRGCKFASKVEGEGWCAYLFNGADRSVAVLWADDEVQVRLDTSLPQASYLVDLMGNTRPLPEAGGLTVSEEPLYVVGRGTSADALRDALARDY